MTILKFVYTVFIGVLLATFVGVGISAFYTSPEQLEYPHEMRPIPVALDDKCASPTAEIIEEQKEFEKASSKHEEKMEAYNRNVSIIALISAIIILVVSLTLFKQIMVIADGLLLGGVLTLIYSIIRGFEAGDEMFRFVVVSIGLTVSLILGYIKFIKTSKK